VRGWNRDTGDDFSEIPEEVRARLPDIGGKGTPRLVRRTILELCSWRPLMPMEIAQYMNRKSVKRLVESYISPMFEEGVLERTIPETPSHPAQRYSITGKGTQEIL